MILQSFETTVNVLKFRTLLFLFSNKMMNSQNTYELLYLEPFNLRTAFDSNSLA